MEREPSSAGSREQGHRSRSQAARNSPSTAQNPIQVQHNGRDSSPGRSRSFEEPVARRAESPSDGPADPQTGRSNRTYSHSTFHSPTPLQHHQGNPSTGHGTWAQTTTSASNPPPAPQDYIPYSRGLPYGSRPVTPHYPDEGLSSPGSLYRNRSFSPFLSMHASHSRRRNRGYSDSSPCPSLSSSSRHRRYSNDSSARCGDRYYMDCGNSFNFKRYSGDGNFARICMPNQHRGHRIEMPSYHHGHDGEMRSREDDGSRSEHSYRGEISDEMLTRLDTFVDLVVFITFAMIGVVFLGAVVLIVAALGRAVV